MQIHEVESTKRARIQAYEATEVARIKAAEPILRDYFEQAFAERRDLCDEMFARLDRALDEEQRRSAPRRGAWNRRHCPPIPASGHGGIWPGPRGARRP